MRNASVAHRGGVLDAVDGGLSRRPLLASSVLITALVLFCIFTHWGDTYTEFAINAWKALKVSRAYPMERRREALYGDTYDLLRSLRDATPPDAVILLPPIGFIMEKHGGQIPVMGSPSSAYSIIYPRVPVHYGSASPCKDKITHMLVWEHWGLHFMNPPPEPTEQNRIQLMPVLKGGGLQW